MSARVARLFNLWTRMPRFQQVAADLHGRLFRISGGRLIRRWFGAPVMVIETVGRRSGKTRRTPVIYMPDGDRFIVIAANAGSNRTPAWWLNLRDAGWGVAVFGSRRERVVPRQTEGVEQAELWRRFAAGFPALDRYRTFTERQIPLVVLEPAAERGYPPGD